jgi:hypothetical protein
VLQDRYVLTTLETRRSSTSRNRTTAFRELAATQTGRAWFGSVLALMTLVPVSTVRSGPGGGHAATYCRCSGVEDGHLRRRRRRLCVAEQEWESARRNDHGGTDSIQTCGRLGLVMVAMSARIKDCFQPARDAADARPQQIRPPALRREKTHVRNPRPRQTLTKSAWGGKGVEGWEKMESRMLHESNAMLANRHVFTVLSMLLG